MKRKHSPRATHQGQGVSALRHFQATSVTTRLLGTKLGSHRSSPSFCFMCEETAAREEQGLSQRLSEPAVEPALRLWSSPGTRWAPSPGPQWLWEAQWDGPEEGVW